MESLTYSSDILQDLHFYIMWFSLLCAVSCLIKDTTCHLFRSKYIKLLIFGFMVFAGFSWVNNLNTVKNFPNFSDTSNELDLLKLKHSLSKLQRDVYLHGIETFCLLLLLIVPRYQQYYEDTLIAFNRRVKELSSKAE